MPEKYESLPTIRISAFAVVVAFLLYGYWQLFVLYAPMVFNAQEEDLSFGWYIPLFSLYVLWRERRKLVDSIGNASWSGLLASIPFLLLGLIGIRGLQVRFIMLGFIGLVVTLPWTFFGLATARRMLFPAAFLMFCIPLHSFLDVITIHLRLFAVSIAYEVAKGCGIDVIRQGTMLTSSSGSFAIDIAEPCSGMRSLFAMMALAAGYAYFTQSTLVKRWLLFALSIPIAIAGNVMRILSIIVVASVCSPDFATGFYHDYSGFVVFFVAISLMVACGGLMARGGGKCVTK